MLKLFHTNTTPQLIIHSPNNLQSPDTLSSPIVPPTAIMLSWSHNFYLLSLNIAKSILLSCQLNRWAFFVQGKMPSSQISTIHENKIILNLFSPCKKMHHLDFSYFFCELRNEGLTKLKNRSDQADSVIFNLHL